MLQSPVDQSVFARAYDLDGALPTPYDWQLTPGNTGAIYNQFLRPAIVQRRDQAMLETCWTARFRQERARAGNSAHYAQIREPSLRWERAEDYLKIGSDLRSYKDMLEILKTYPTHPNTEKWIASFRKKIAPPPPVEPPPASDPVPEPSQEEKRGATNTGG